MALQKKDWIVRPISVELGAEIVRQHHYSGSCSHTSVLTVGLYPVENPVFGLCGTSIWLPPPPGLCKKYGLTLSSMLTLSRLAICPSVPKNGASFLIGQSIRLIKKKLPHVKKLITYADTWQNHTGAIYRATNWTYDGLTQPALRWVDGTGKLVSKLSTITKSTTFMDDNYDRVSCAPMHRFFMDI